MYTLLNLSNQIIFNFNPAIFEKFTIDDRLCYAYLGPAGTFTEAALRTITQTSDELIPCSNVTAALDAVRTNSADRALVPIENSVEGVVARTLDELAIGEPLVIYGEVTLPVTFSLLVSPGKEKSSIKKIATDRKSVV